VRSTVRRITSVKLVFYAICGSGSKNKSPGHKMTEKHMVGNDMSHQGTRHGVMAKF